MSDPLARSRRITRRTFAVSALAALGLALARVWPSLGPEPSAALDALANLPEAAALKALGARPEAAALEDVAARLEAKLETGGYQRAVAADRASGAVVPVDGWRLPETKVLAAAWLAARG